MTSCFQVVEANKNRKHGAKRNYLDVHVASRYKNPSMEEVMEETATGILRLMFCFQVVKSENLHTYFTIE